MIFGIWHFFAHFRHLPKLLASLPGVRTESGLREVKHRYDMIAKAGFLLQVDCPDLAMGRHTRFKERSLEEFRTAIKGNVATMSAALADIPAERIRMHLCWGNYPGPHHHDVPLQDVIDIVLTCKPKFISIEACNPGHAHEWEVFETVVWPDNKVVILGWDISVRAMLAPVYRYTITGTSVYR